jgi:hypothetical protein
MLTDIHLSIQIFAHLDDVIVLGRSFEDMVTNLKKVYDRLLAAGLKLKASSYRINDQMSHQCVVMGRHH